MRDRPLELMGPREFGTGRRADATNPPPTRASSTALILAWVLSAGAVGVAVPPAYADDEPDQIIEGTEDPNVGNPDDSADDPDFDPGGEDNPGAVHDDDSVGDLDDPSLDGAPGPPLPGRPPATPAPVTPRGPTAPPQATQPGSGTMPTAPEGPGKRREVSENGKRSAEERVRTRARYSPGSPRQPPPAHQAYPGPLRAEPPQAAPDATSPSAHQHSKVHVVTAGESLWAIAVQALGPEATPQQVAVEVDRLWESNRGAIGTGSPDLLRIGTRLRVP